MGFSVEVIPTSSLLARLGVDHERYGDPYTASLLVVPDGEGGAELKGFSGKAGRAAILSGLKYLRDHHDIRNPQWERVKSGKSRRVTPKEKDMDINAMIEDMAGGRDWLNLMMVRGKAGVPYSVTMHVLFHADENLLNAAQITIADGVKAWGEAQIAK